MIPWYKKLSAYIAGAFALLLGAFFIQKRRAEKASSELQSAKHNAEDAVLSERGDVAKKSIKEEEANLNKLKNAAPSSVDNLSPEEVKRYWENE